MKNLTSFSDKELIMHIIKTKECRSKNLAMFTAFAKEYTKSIKLKDLWKAFNESKR